jgi:hypothetical protein
MSGRSTRGWRPLASRSNTKMKLRDRSAAALSVLILSACGSTAGESLFSPTPVVSSGGGFSTGGVTYVPPSTGGDSNADTGGVTGAGGETGTGVGGVAPIEAGTPDSSGTLGPTGCNFGGTWATYISVPVSWPAAPLILQAGAGALQQWNLSHQVQVGIDVKSATVPCSIFLPDLKGDIFGGYESYGIRFPNSLFDAGAVPFVSFVMTATLGPTGLGFTTESFATLLGLDLANPTQVAWPDLSSMKIVDHDLDGKPGVTVVPATGANYSFPPTDTAGNHADLIYIAERTVATLQGSFSGCDQTTGSVSLLPVSGGTGIDSTVVGCRKTDGTECSNSDASFVNVIRPVYKPTGPGNFVSVRLPKNGTCADVRARFPKM